MDERKDRLVQSAAQLYQLGIALDRARERLRQLAERGVPYSSPEMMAAYREFSQLEQQWQEQETAHLRLRDEIVGKPQDAQ